MSATTSITLPFAVNTQVFLLKETKRNDKSVFSFEQHTIKEFRIVVDENGQNISVKMEDMKPLYEVGDCFLNLNEIQKEINKRTGVGQPAIKKTVNTAPDDLLTEEGSETVNAEAETVDFSI